jgi:hypothetical protein
LFLPVGDQAIDYEKEGEAFVLGPAVAFAADFGEDFGGVEVGALLVGEPGIGGPLAEALHGEEDVVDGFPLLVVAGEPAGAAGAELCEGLAGEGFCFGVGAGGGCGVEEIGFGVVVGGVGGIFFKGVLKGVVADVVGEMVAGGELVHAWVDEVELAGVGHLVEEDAVHEAFEAEAALDAFGAPDGGEAHGKEAGGGFVFVGRGEGDDAEGCGFAVGEGDGAGVRDSMPEDAVAGTRGGDVLAGGVEGDDGGERRWREFELAAFGDGPDVEGLLDPGLVGGGHGAGGWRDWWGLGEGRKGEDGEGGEGHYWEDEGWGFWHEGRESLRVSTCWDGASFRDVWMMGF